ncbi:MAG: amidase family protein [Xanthobacteraceae bacterium]
MSVADELNRCSATEQARLIRAKTISPVELLQAHLEAIERLDPKINAICTLAADSAMAAAKRAERAVMAGEEIGLLHGLPIGIKDVTPTAGIRTTFGSPLHADHVPTEDAAVVARIKQAGAIVIGKTNTPEFAAGANTVNRLFGATCNPWNLALSVGGSTGGGGAALASGMVALAEGTDFGGSLRVPAAFCGVVGLRPTAGLVPRFPTPLPWDVGTVHGPMARTAEDAALLLEAMIDDSGLTPIAVRAPWKSPLAAVAQSHDLKNVRIGYAADIAGTGIDPEISDACRTATKRLVDCGATVDELEFSLADGRDAYLVLRGLTMIARFFEYLNDTERFEPNLKGNIEAGLKLTISDVAGAERKRAELWHRWRTLFERFDLLLTPTTPVPPFPVEQNYPHTIAGRKMTNYIDWIASTFLVTLSSLPAASVPCGLTAAGLPIGIQIIGPRFAEPKILATAKVVQAMNPLRWPPFGATASQA